MEIQDFQAKLKELCEQAHQSENRLEVQEIRSCFADMELERDQLLQLVKYLKLQGITIEGFEVEVPVQTHETEEPQSVQLPDEEQEYLDHYKEMLPAFSKVETEVLFRRLAAGENVKEQLSNLYLGVAADMAAAQYTGEILLADLIQEANVSLLLALSLEEPHKKDDAWLRAELQRGIREAIAEQSEQKVQDESLVERVTKLETAVKDLSENDDGTESKFTVGELAIILDMEIDEIKDVLRLTGDYSGEDEENE